MQHAPRSILSSIFQQNASSLYAFTAAVVIHLAAASHLLNWLKPTAVVVDQTTYKVSITHRQELPDSEAMTPKTTDLDLEQDIKESPSDVVSKVPEQKVVKEQVADFVQQEPLPVQKSIVKKSSEELVSRKVQKTSRESPVELAKQEQAPSIKEPQPLDPVDKTATAAELKAAEEPRASSNTEKEVEPTPLQQDVAERIRQPEFQVGSPNNPKPIYPNRAIKQGWEGDVILGVHVASDGAVTYVEILESSNISALDFAAYSTVKDEWRFSPADASERDLKGYVTVPISFRIN